MNSRRSHAARATGVGKRDDLLSVALARPSESIGIAVIDEPFSQKLARSNTASLC